MWLRRCWVVLMMGHTSITQRWSNHSLTGRDKTIPQIHIRLEVIVCQSLITFCCLSHTPVTQGNTLNSWCAPTCTILDEIITLVALKKGKAVKSLNTAAAHPLDWKDWELGMSDFWRFHSFLCQKIWFCILKITEFKQMPLNCIVLYYILNLWNICVLNIT